jgi:lauroyl/myristoyl acyltransferase
MTSDDSITDMDVAVAGGAFLRTARQLPPEHTLRFLADSLDWERANTLAARCARYRAAVEPVFRDVPALADRAPDLAAEWARRHSARGLNSVGPLMYAADPRLTVETEGAEHLERAAGGGRGPLVISLHSGPYQALPAFLSTRLGLRVTSFMDGGAYGIVHALHEAVAPELLPSLDAIGLPAADSTRRALATVRSGRALMTMPEFTLGERSPQTLHPLPFMGRTVQAPIGTARLARALRVPIVPVRLVRDDVARFRIVVDEPLSSPSLREPDEQVTERVFAWLESTVSEDPAAWWCWEIFDSVLTQAPPAPAPEAAPAPAAVRAAAPAGAPAPEPGAVRASEPASASAPASAPVAGP